MARRRDEPFNPFTASSSSRGRGRELPKKRPPPAEKAATDGPIDRKAMQKAMMAKVLAVSDESKEISKVPEEVKEEITEADIIEPPSPEIEQEDDDSDTQLEQVEEVDDSDSEEIPPQEEPSRIDDLKRRSQELAEKTGHNYAEVKQETVSPASPSSASKIPAPAPKPRPPRRFHKVKTGGGRQPKRAKLDRRKQLEFRFDTRRILENPSVPEEHRSNLLGQIWAKGERMGIDAANEYIEQKALEGVIDDEIKVKLLELVKNYTTKR